MEDRSFEEAKKVHLPGLVVAGYRTNHGKGHAVRYGMAKCTGDVIGFMDAGGDLKEEGLSMMLEHMRWYNADIIIGSKRHPVSKVRYPFGRRVLSWGYQLLIRLFFGLSIRDSQVGMKLYRREVLEDVLPRLLVKQFAFDIEILAVAHRLGYTRIYEAPIELDFSGMSSITSLNFWHVIWKTLWDTMAVFYRLKILRYYDNTNKRKWRFDPELNFRINIG
jgi:glycosyltransferase involved in cell wall biosynthesis